MKMLFEQAELGFSDALFQQVFDETLHFVIDIKSTD